MRPVTDIYLTEDVIMITAGNIVNEAKDIFAVFKAFSDDGIILDMISSAPRCSSEISVSFTASGTDLEKILLTAGRLKKSGDVSLEISSGNAKICLAGEGMQTSSGVMTRILNRMLDEEIEIKLVSTSETEVSLLVSDSDADNAVDVLAREFGI